MSTDIINVYPTCAQCGSKLLVDRVGADPGPKDPVICPVHGVIGTRHKLDIETARQVQKNGTEEVGKALLDIGFERE